MAVHTTSASWEDFRLTCSLLDLKVPSRDMSRTQLNTFMESSVTLAKKSMKLAGEEANSHANGVDESASGLRECSVSFDASWHRRGHYSTKVSLLRLRRNLGRCWNIPCTTESAIRVASGRNLEVSLAQKSSQSIGPDTKPFVLQTTKVLRSR